jgi:uncharacterized protein (AIM24 family)
MEYEISGNNKQIIEIKLKEGERIYTQAGAFAWMSGNVHMSTEIMESVSAALGRALHEDTHCLLTFECKGEDGKVTLSPEVPSYIHDMKLESNEKLILHQNVFLAAEETLSRSIDFKDTLLIGVLRSEGHVFEEITGPGSLLLQFPGDLYEQDLKENESILADPDHIAGFHTSVRGEVQMIQDPKTIRYFEQGLYLVKFTGPGKIWLQSRPMAK